MAENQSGEVQTVETLLDSTLESVDEAEATVLRMASKAGLEEDDLHALGMAVREAAVNAVVHGNRYNARKKVHLTEIRPPETLLRQSGRGLLLIRAFVDEFDLHHRPPRGTEIQLVKYLAKAS